MKTHYLFLVLLSFTLFFTNCTKDEEIRNENNPEIPEVPETPKIPEEFKDSYLNTTIKLEDLDATEFYKDCYISSILDKIPVSDKAMELQSNINKKVQTYFLTDGNEDIYMMTRVSNTENNKTIEFNAENTALSFVTFHPFFAHIDSQAYDFLIETIKESKNFPKVCTEISNIIKQKKGLYNESNTTLFEALNSLLDELIVFANYKPEEETTSRAITNETLYYPFRLNSSGNRLDFQVFGLNPNYYGTATHANGNIERLVVQSHEDFGFLASLESVLNILNKKGWDANQYGEIESYTFPAEGECQFNFSCKTKENEIDLIARVLTSACDMAGIYVDQPISDIINNTADYLEIITQEVNNASYELATPTFPFYNIAGEAIEKLLTDGATDLMNAGIEQAYENEINTYKKLIETTNDKNILNAYNNRIQCLQKSKALLKKVTGIYSAVKGIGNIATRLIAAYRATNPIDFKLCYYNNEIRNCSHIQKYKGDNQTGFYGVELNEPISVAINFDNGNFSDYIVKFEVYKGGGTVGSQDKTVEWVEVKDYIVEINWTMGSDSEEQIVQAYLCEKDSKEAVCEPVEFKATAETELLSIYIENIAYEESPFYTEGYVTFKPIITISTDEPDKLNRLYDWGLIIYEEKAGRDEKIETIQMGIDYTSIDLTRTFKLNKTDLNLDYNNYIAKNDKKYSVGSYVIYEEGGSMVESDILVPIELVYDQKPTLSFTNLDVGPIEPHDYGFMDRKITYYVDITATGSLWIDNVQLFRGDQEGGISKLASYTPIDGVLDKHYSYTIFPSGAPDVWTHWEYLVGSIKGKELKSINSVFHYWHGPIYNIYLYDGIP